MSILKIVKPKDMDLQFTTHSFEPRSTMVSRSTRSSRRLAGNSNERAGIDNDEDVQDASRIVEDQPLPLNEPAVVEQNVLPNAVRDRQRAVAEREASRLARPDGTRSMYRLSHADRKKSAVTSTPSGIATLASTENHDTDKEVAEIEEWCGPWSVARQMIAKREDAKRRREELENEENVNGENHPLDEAMEEFALEQKRKQHPSMQWRSSSSYKSNTNGRKESLYGKRQKRMNLIQQGKKVPSLFYLCISFLAENVDSIESLGIDTDADIRTAVMDRLIADQLLNDDALNVLAEVGIDTLQVSDGSNITEECLCSRFEILIPSGLKDLSIDQCGRCFTDKTVRSIINSLPKKKSLKNVMIGGAYGLQDIDAALLIEGVAPSSLSFKACNLLGILTCQSFCNTYTNTPLIELALEDIPLTSDDLKVMTSKLDTWKNLKSLSLRRVSGLDDSFLHSMFELCTTLEYLDLTENVQLSDAILASLRYHNVAHRLHTLNLQGLKHVTAIGLEAFFTATPSETDSSAPRPIMLQVLNLGQCSHDTVSDEVIRLVTGGAPIPIDHSNVEVLDGEDVSTSTTFPSFTNMNYHSLGSGGLISLNVQGSTMLTDNAMEYLASNKSPTYRTLKELNISFCPNITDQGLGYLIDSCQPQLRTIHVWGNAQLTDNVYDGHQRIDDASLEIVGVWMKKASSRTIR